MRASLNLRLGVATHPGLARSNNEDNHFHDVQRGIFAVIDGVGGHNAGERAAAIAAEVVSQRLLHPEGTPLDALREGITVANNRIFHAAAQDRSLAGMACVMSAAVVSPGKVSVGHVGDSRIYKIEGGRILKLTHDHSPVGEREDRGELNELEAMRHLRRNEVYRDVGTEPHQPEDNDFIELLEAPFELDAALLLCSDGLTDLVTAGEILDVVLEHAGQPQKTVDRLIQRALEEGGKDNVTVMVVEGPDFGRVRTRARDHHPRLYVPPGASTEPQRTRPRSTSRAWTQPQEILPPGPEVAQGEARLETPVGRFRVRTLLGVAAGALLIALGVYAFFPSRPQPVNPTPKAAPSLAGVIEVGPEEDLQAAINQSNPGTIIRLNPGVFVGPLRLRSGVTLVASGSGRSTLEGNAKEPALVARNIQDSRVIGLTLQAGGADTAVLLENSAVGLIDVEIQGAVKTGILASHNAQPLLWKVRFVPEKGNNAKLFQFDESVEPVIEMPTDIPPESQGQESSPAPGGHREPEPQKSGRENPAPSGKRGSK